MSEKARELGVKDGREFCRGEFCRDNSDDRALVERALADPLGADEGLLNALGYQGTCKFFGVADADALAAACRAYNEGFSAALRAWLDASEAES